MISPQQKATILIIENDLSNRILLERILATFGYRYISTSNGFDALEHLKREPVDLVLTDLSMPVLDGISIAGMIRQMPGLATIPIVVLTGYSIQDKQQEIRQAGCSDLITKPYRPKELLAVIARHLRTQVPL
jgi:CheY-like chemotaxis protein